LLAAGAAAAVLVVVTLTADDDRRGPSLNLPADGVAESTAGDSGFVNPWAAGNAAAARYLSQLGRQCASAAPGVPEPAGAR
jgi:hypothetical protein